MDDFDKMMELIRLQHEQNMQTMDKLIELKRTQRNEVTTDDAVYNVVRNSTDGTAT